MVTSRSAEPQGNWVGGALLFSGRRDPTWVIDEHVAQQLVSIWDTLAPRTGELPARPLLGYRGCFLRNLLGQEWLAYRDAVTLQMAGGSESRSDPERSFEKRLLASASEGLLPPYLVEDN